MRAALAATVVLLAAAALGAYLYDRNRTGNVYHPHAPFIAQPTPTLPTPSKRGPANVTWPR